MELIVTDRIGHNVQMRISGASRTRLGLWLVAFLGLLGLTGSFVRADVVPPPPPSETRTLKDGAFELTFQGRPPVCFAIPESWRESRACEGVDPKQLDPAALPIRAEGTRLARAVMRNPGGDLQLILLKGPRQNKAFDMDDSDKTIRSVIQSVRESPLLKNGSGGVSCNEEATLLGVAYFNGVQVVSTQIQPTFTLKGAAELELDIEHHEILAQDATYRLIVWYPLAVRLRGHWESRFLLGCFIAARRELPGVALGYYMGLAALPGSLVGVLIWIFLRQRRLNAQKAQRS